MSSDLVMCCASCGVAEVDDIKLMTCDACDLVRYCSVECQQDHRPKHVEICKKREGELRDEVLFRPPESSHLGDCPICCLPLSLEHTQSVLQSCCSKLICNGCDCANDLRQIEQSLDHKCPFCRHPVPNSAEEVSMLTMERVVAKDPIALCQMGTRRFQEGDYEIAFEYWKKAAELGDAESHFKLAGCLYAEGKGVEKDEKKELYHLEEAAIGGNPFARCSLAIYEMQNGSFDRAVKHHIIAANLGCDESIKMLEMFCAAGHVSKEDFAAALRAHQAAVDATKSPQREKAVTLRE